VVKPKLCRLEKSDEADVKKYFKRDPSNDKKSNKPNSAPSSSREQSPAPQKLAPNPFSKAKKKEETPPSSPTPEKLVPNPFSSDKKKTTLTPATGKSFSVALILASTTPQNDKRLFIELQLQYMKIASSEHVVYIHELFWMSKKQTKNNLCTQHVVSLQFSYTELVIHE
jgi:hypothetical protein